jgi:hypothetical protein
VEAKNERLNRIICLIVAIGIVAWSMPGKFVM